MLKRRVEKGVHICKDCGHMHPVWLGTVIQSFDGESWWIVGYTHQRTQEEALAVVLRHVEEDAPSL